MRNCFESRSAQALSDPKGSNGVRRSAGNAARAVIEVGACGLLPVMRAGHAVLTIQASHIKKAWCLLPQCVKRIELGRRNRSDGRTVL